MILADSSVLIEFVRKPSLPLARVVVTGKAAICGITVAEMHAGARSEAHRQDVAAISKLFGDVPIDQQVWALAGRISAAMAGVEPRSSSRTRSSRRRRSGTTSRCGPGTSTSAGSRTPFPTWSSSTNPTEV